MAIRIILFVVTALDVFWWSWADARLRKLKTRRLWRVLLAGFVLMQIVSMGSRLLRPVHFRTLNDFLPLPIVAAQYLWHLLILPLSILVPMLMRLGSFVGTTARDLFVERVPVVDDPTAGPSRRQMLAAMSVAVPPLLLAGSVGAAVEQDGHFRIRNLSLSLPQLPRQLDGMTIAHITDLHIGRFMQPRMLPAVVNAVNSLKCDMVAFTGDLIDYALGDLQAGIDAIRQMEPRDGMVMCVGNHDLFENRQQFISRVERVGIPLLIDSSMELRIRGQAVQVLGIDWAHGDKALADLVGRVAPLRREDAFPILLAHHPHAFDAAAAAGFPLTLSGHTHGGQLMLTDQVGVGSLLFRYTSGVYWKNNSALFVNNGIGNWFPLRINAPAEIVKITLRCV